MDLIARVAKHWRATKPIICPRQTSPAFGGDPGKVGAGAHDDSGVNLDAAARPLTL